MFVTQDKFSNDNFTVGKKKSFSKTSGIPIYKILAGLKHSLVLLHGKVFLFLLSVAFPRPETLGVYTFTIAALFVGRSNFLIRNKKQ